MLDETGQITIDYIAGVSIFLTTLFFVYYFMSGAFAPFQSSSDEVTLMADKVAVLLVEDRLLVEKGRPNVLHATSLEIFLNDIDNEYDSTIDSLGLNGSFRDYDINVTLQKMNESTPSRMAGPPLPAFESVGQTKRVVLIHNPDIPSEIAIMAVRVW